MSEIKDRLKLFRRDKDLTQEDLATQTAISRTYISTVEAGRQDPSFSFIKTLSKTYNLSIDWLLTGEGSMFSFFASFMIDWTELPDFAKNEASLYTSFLPSLR